jgi:hypothetical protein
MPYRVGVQTLPEEFASVKVIAAYTSRHRAGVSIN